MSDNPNISINNQADFAYALLGRLGITPNPGNVTAVVAWERAEGGNWNNSAHFNPLNTTQGEPGSTAMNGVGVQSYQSWTQGLDATVATLRNGRYGSILSALQGSDPYAVANAVGASPWGTPNFSNLIGSSAGSSVPSSGVAQLVAQPPMPNGAPGAATDDHCIFSWPGGGSFGPIPLPGGGCAFGTSQARALLGGMIVLGGVAIGVVGVAIVVGAGLSGSRMAGATARMAGAVPFGRDTYQRTTKSRYSPADATRSAIDSDQRLHEERAARESKNEKESGEGREYERNRRDLRRAGAATASRN